jgi:hypothetical protein
MMAVCWVVTTAVSLVAATPVPVLAWNRHPFVAVPAALVILKPDLTELVYASYLGGSGDDLIRSPALGPNGEIYLVGNTSSTDFPVTPGAAQSKLRGASDAFVMKLVPLPQ